MKTIIGTDTLGWRQEQSRKTIQALCDMALILRENDAPDIGGGLRNDLLDLVQRALHSATKLFSVVSAPNGQPGSWDVSVSKELMKNPERADAVLDAMIDPIRPVAVTPHANERQRRTNLVKLNTRSIDLLFGHGYPIEYDRIDTPEKALGWLHHLAGKGLFTMEHMRALIEIIHELGVPVDYHA